MAAVNRRRVLVMADQGVSSLSNVLVSIFVARSLSPTGFGAFGVAVLGFMLTLGVSRSLISEPFLSQHSEESAEERARLVPHMIVAAAVAGGAAAVVVAVLGLVSGGQSGSVLVALAVVLPLMVIQDAWRYAFIIDRPGAALAVDGAWLVSVCLVLPLAPHDARPAWFVVAWGVTSGLGSLAGWLLTRDSFFVPRPDHWFSDHREMGTRFLGEFVTGQAVSQLILVGLGAMAGLGALGAVRAAQVFYGPINTVHTGAYLTLVPEGARAATRPSRMRRLMALASAGLCLISLLWMIVGLAMPDSWGEALLGASWDEAGDLLVPMGLATMAGSLVTGGFAGVRSLGAARDSLRARLRSVPAMLALPLAGAALAEGRGYAAGLGIAQVVTAVIWWWAFLRALSRRTTRSRARAVLEAVSG